MQVILEPSGHYGYLKPDEISNIKQSKTKKSVPYHGAREKARGAVSIHPLCYVYSVQYMDIQIPNSSNGKD